MRDCSSSVFSPAAAVAVVIPCYRARATIASVLHAIPPEVAAIYVVDDGCPNGSGDVALNECRDPRLTVLRNGRNLGVGGAVKAGYRRALADGAEIVVKLDADGQMDPRHIPLLIAPILAGRADYAKGNRFAAPELMPPGARGGLASMPRRRWIGNSSLSLLHGLATGYWDVADPANGYTAIDARMLSRMGVDAVADCFFFETDMLHRLNLSGARVVEVPLPAFYPGTGSTLSLRRVAPRFAGLIVSRSLGRLRARRRRGGGPAAAVPTRA
jgi:glycosyltransferase involved in cell wall biosynthesis